MKDFESKILECWNAIKFPLATLIVLIISHNKITVCLINPFIEYLNDFNLINTDNLIFITKISVIILILFYLHKSVRKNYILGKRSIFWILVLFGYFFLITQNKMLSNNKIIEVLKFLNLIPYILICYPLAFLIFNGVINYPSWAEHFYKNIISQLNKIINYIFNKKQTPKKAKNSFYLDEINLKNIELPIRLNEIKKSIANKIVTTTTNESFSVGILGNWGIGKTTFLEFLSEELKQEKNIIEIKFCPWLLESEKHYTEDLLNKIGFELKKYHSEGDTKMKNYLKSILKSLKFEVAGIASISIENFFTQNTFHNDIKIINRIIERTGKKIVIFIDDIDRMEGKEILKIFKLIRNVANFKNTFFIIPYDKEYINQCLIEEKIENSFEFMKKFFQYELHLRKNKIENIRLLLINELDKWLDIKKEEVIDSTKKDVINNIQISLKENNSELLIEKAIFNFRDVYRFMNVFAENFTNELIGEVYFPDFFNITLLRYGYPTIYDTLFYKKEELVTNIQINKSDYNVLTDSLLEHYVIKEPNDKKLDDILRENSVEYNISSKDINNVNSLLQDLFLKEYSKTGMWVSEKKNNPFKNKELSLKYIIYYDKYFEHSMQGNLSEIEFQTAMTKSTDEIFSYILSKTKNIEELTFKLNRINFSSFERRENYESFFQALCKIISDDSDKFYRKHNLSELILYYDSTKNKKLNKFYQNEDDYLDFIFTTLKEFDTVSNNLFNIFNEKYLSSFTLENSSFSKNYFERLRNYSIERFNTFLENEKSYSWNLWYAFMSLEKINEKNIDFKKNYAENKEKLKLFIIKYLDNFICNNKGSYCIRFCRQHRNNYQFEKDLIVELFGSIDAFIKTLQESDSIYLEDIKLLNDTIEKNETGCADIDFEEINLPRNREF